MSTPGEVFFSDSIKNFYSSHLREHGNSAKGVGWKNSEAQHIRFDQLLKIIKKSDYSINDLGCGVGELYPYLKARQPKLREYRGYDLLEDMIVKARELFPNPPDAIFQRIESPAGLTPADYSVASGIFNVKYQANESDWLHYVLGTLDQMNANSQHGFSFNLLTKYSDKEFMQEYLYYADPLFYFDFCKRNYSKNVALLHDYDQYDFTILVRKN